MWDGADPDVIVDAYRHTQSKANVENANFGNKTPLSPKGERQVPYIFKDMKKRRIELIVCSHADRAYGPVVSNAHVHGLPIAPHEFFNEFRRPEGTIGKSNDDPRVKEILKRRIEEFGTAHESLDGAETFAETILVMMSGLEELRQTAIAHGKKRLGLLSHGLRLRQIEAWILSEGDWDKFAGLFKALYRVGGFANGAHKQFWFGYPFRESPKYKENAEKCWNIELASDSHIPLKLR